MRPGLPPKPLDDIRTQVYSSRAKASHDQLAQLWIPDPIPRKNISLSEMSATGTAELVELDSLEILVIIDNELDPISPSPNPAVQQSGGIKDITMRAPPLPSTARGGSAAEFRMDHICCSAHGLSLMITGIKDNSRRTILFDTGPEESAWERNATRLQASITDIEAIQLSHWHRDHSGGMLKVLSMINTARLNQGLPHRPVHVDLHPARPDYRGVQPPNSPVLSFEADPTFSEIENHSATVHKSSEPHTILDNTFLISGEIPKVTPYEKGLKYGVRFSTQSNSWSTDEAIIDERMLMCKLKGSPPPHPIPLPPPLTPSTNPRRQRHRPVHRLQPHGRSQRLQIRSLAREQLSTVRSNGRVPSCRRSAGTDTRDRE